MGALRDGIRRILDLWGFVVCPMVRMIAPCGAVAFAATAVAHHSPNVHFDRNDVVEIEGVLTEVEWRNPHIQLTITTHDESGNEVAWQVEESNRNVQLRRGVTEDDYQVGEVIRVAGFRGLRNRTALFATNTLLASGRELLGSTASGARWTSDLVMTKGDYQASKLGIPAIDSNSLFRVWSVAAETHLPGTSPYGYSVGRWEGETLVVSTTDIDWPWFDQSGVPQSAALHLVERFSPSEGGQHLDYSVEATDPAVFTEPVRMQKRWSWIPGEEVKPYDCSYERDDL